MKRIVVAALVLSIFLQPAVAFAVGPPGWPVYLWNNARDNAYQDNVTFGSAPLRLTEKWSAQMCGSVTAGPVIGSLAALVGCSDGYLYSMNLALHRLNWKIFLGTAVTASGQRGVTAPPTYAGDLGTHGVVFAGGGGQTLASDPHLYLYALDAQTGAVLWQTSVGNASTTAIADSPLYLNGHVFVGTSGLAARSATKPRIAGKVFEIDATTGVIIRQVSMAAPGKKGGEVSGSIAANSAGTRIYVPTGAGQTARTQKLTYALAALDSGTLRTTGHWQAPARQAAGTNGFGTAVTVFTSGARTLLGAGMTSGMYYAMDAAHMKKGPVWKRRLANTTRSKHAMVDTESAAYATGSIYPGGTTLFVAAPNARVSGTTTTGALYALNPSNGHVIWSVPVGGQAQAGAVTVYDDVVIVPVQNAPLSSASGGAVEVRSVHDGHLLGTFATSGVPVSPVIVLYGDLVFATQDGVLHVVSMTH